MTTSELLAIIEPYADMLRELGWTVEDYDNPISISIFLNGRGEVMYTDFAARIIADVAMEELAKWAYKPDGYSWEIVCYELNGNWTTFTYAPEGDAHATSREFVAPTRLAAILALLHWTRTH